MDIELDAAGMARVHLVAENAQDGVVGEVAEDARRYVPVDDGELRASIHVQGDTVVVGTDHWAPQEFGARPHVIEAAPDSALSWPGGAHPVGEVRHPGNKAQPFMRPAVYKKRDLR